MPNEALVRLAAFATVFALMALWELLAPRRSYRTKRGRRWWANLGLVALDTLAVRLVFPVAAMGMAMLAEERGWGLLNNVGWPYAVRLLLALAVLDFAIYLQHVMFHAVPILWRLHLVHHMDLDFDVTTGVRFHPIEIVVSMGIKIAAVAALGPPVLAVLAFEVLLNATSMFNHSNVRMPVRLDRVLRWFVVTPDMHRVHHSVSIQEANHNFGFNLPWWDRLCGTYQPQPGAGHENMTIGVEQYQEPAVQKLSWLLVVPFSGRPGRYSVTRRFASRAEAPQAQDRAE